ncbi:hypothetical protein J7399_13310 [Shimia sp. R9_1]|uniref:hypothetical protein n=1 Tax=Shimia sp. R9_1 TaxID=2821111 RepID=UPI001AD99B87|nr:hypothetical protein [Shimia sp. R9_1]MBO9408411.1 hypothetical protein [Shimia sp. R9_1]
MGENTQHQSVRKRRVFYIPGYDPIHPRRYRELYRKEGAAQAEISGYEMALAPKMAGAGPFGWHATGRFQGVESEADFEVLIWSDIVKDSMDQGIFATYVQLLRTAWIYIGSGALARLMKLRKGPVIAALYPVVFLLTQLVFALLVAWGVGALLALVLPWWSKVFGLLVVPPILKWFQRHDGKFFAYYLMHDYAYSASTRGANPVALEARMAQFKERIAEALQSDCDEVLVVGHSSGAHLAVSVLSDLLRENRLPKEGPKLAFLSLGQVVPMVSFLSDSYRLRADLAFLCQREDITWVDVTAPGDGCAFALCDPVSVTGVAPESGKKWPLVVSAAFTLTLTPERWKELRWRFFRLHFQYLCAFDKPGHYDYFQITAGPLTLAERYEGRSPSKSRIEKPVNKFTKIAP